MTLPSEAAKQINSMKNLTKSYVVGAEQTAVAMGSGDMEVLATPALVCMMENAAMTLAADGLADGSTTVGSEISTSHVRPSAVGATIVVEVTLTAQEGRRMDFEVRATDGGLLVGEGKHTRYVVDRARFLSKMK